MHTASTQGCSKARHRWPTVLLVICAFSSARGLRTLQLSVGDAQLFAQAVADFGTTGEDTVLELPQGEVFSLANATIVSAQARPGRQPFSSGTLTIRPAGGNTTGTTVLDAAMQFGMASYDGQPAIFRGTARLVLQHLTLVNLCDMPVVLVGSIHIDSAISMGVFLRTSAYQSHLYENVTIYARQADMTGWMYALAVLQAPFPQLSGPLAPFLILVPKLTMTSVMTTSFYTSGSRFNLPDATGGWIAIASTADPTDTLLQSLRAKGTMLTPQYCMGTGTGTPPDLVNPDTPLWAVGDTKQWVEAVQLATTQSSQLGGVFKLPPIVMLMGRAVPAGYLPTPSFTLRSVMMFTGMRGSVPGVSNPGILDLTSFLGPLITITDTGYLYMELIFIRGFQVRPLPTTGTPSIFPLAAFPFANTTSPISISTSNITLELPDWDYMAFMMLGQPNLTACFNTTVQAHAAALRTSVAGVTLSDISPGYSHMLLSAFNGWGMIATNLNLIPANPDLPSSIACSCQQLLVPNSAATTSVTVTPQHPSGVSTRQIGIIVGSVGGLLLLLAAVIWGAVLMQHIRRQAPEAPEPLPEDEPKSTTGSLHMRHLGNLAKDSMTTTTTTTGFSVRIPSQPARSKAYERRVSAPAPWGRPETGLQMHTSAFYAYQRKASGLGPSARASTETETCNSPAVCYPGPLMLGLDEPLAADTRMAERRYSALQDTPSGTGASGSISQSLQPNPASMHAIALVKLNAQQQYTTLADKDVQQLEQFCGSAASFAAVQRVPLPAGPGHAAGSGLVLVLTNVPPGPGPGGAAQAGPSTGPAAQQAWITYMPQGNTGHYTLNVAPGGIVQTVPGAQQGAQVVTQSVGQQHASTSAGSLSLQGEQQPTKDPKATIHNMVQAMGEQANTVKILGLLGQGSWGTVYCGEWRGLPVAIKTMLFEVVDDGQGLPLTGTSDQQDAKPNPVQRHQYALNEAAVAASVDHRNVVRTYYYDVKSVQTTQHGTSSMTGLQIHGEEVQTGACRIYKLFLVQELCTTSLVTLMANRMLHDHGTGEVHKLGIVIMLLDIAHGLNYLHGKNIVHGDLKPANVLLVPDPTSAAGFVAKLADFGLSARLAVGATHVSNYRSGTPFYVAPEVTQEHRTSPAADIFSFGVLMWQIYSGMSPFHKSPDTGEFVWNPDFPNFKHPNVPQPAYIDLVQKCLTRNPRERPSAAGLIHRLEKLYVEWAGLPPSPPSWVDVPELPTTPEYSITAASRVTSEHLPALPEQASTIQVTDSSQQPAADAQLHTAAEAAATRSAPLPPAPSHAAAAAGSGSRSGSWLRVTTAAGMGVATPRARQPDIARGMALLRAPPMPPTLSTTPALQPIHIHPGTVGVRPIVSLPDPAQAAGMSPAGVVAPAAPAATSRNQALAVSPPGVSLQLSPSQTSDLPTPTLVTRAHPIPRFNQ